MERLPSLIQRVRYRENALRKGIDAFFEFDYMGSSEFEWGALPKSLKLMRELRTKDWKVEKLTVGPHTAYYVGHPEDKATAEALMTDQLLERPQHYTKEWTEMRRSFGVEKSESKYGFDVFDGWWAVDGGYVAAFRDSGVGYAGRPESRPFVIFRKKEHAEKWLEVM